MNRLVFILVMCFHPFVFSATGEYGLDHADINLKDKASLQRGAKVFMNYCLGCHSMQYQRYQRTFDDIGIDEKVAQEYLQYSGAKASDYIVRAMDDKDAEAWFGVEPPDLTLVARVRGPDWVYTYLRTFYKDDSRPFGVNNLVFPDVAMPHVLEPLQGTPIVTYNEEIKDSDAEKHAKGVVTDGSGSLSSEEYDQVVLDLVNFLEYTGEPTRLVSERIGRWVLAFISVFGVLVYLLKKDYWREVH